VLEAVRPRLRDAGVLRDERILTQRGEPLEVLLSQGLEANDVVGQHGAIQADQWLIVPFVSLTFSRPTWPSSTRFVPRSPSRAGLEVAELDVFVEPDLCVARLAARASGP
jgi:hypothetical protein